MPNVLEVGIFSADNYYDPIIPLTADGVAQSLVGCTVQTRLKNLRTGAVLTSATIESPASAGKVRHPWASVDDVTTTVRFQYRVRVVVTFANGKRQTFPAVGQPELRITVVPSDTAAP